MQDVDHRVEVVLEGARGAERLRIDGEEEMAETVRVVRLLIAHADRRKGAPGSVPPRMCTIIARP